MGPPDWHPASPEIRRVGRQIVAFCQDHGVDVSELALRHCFDNSNVATTLVGMATRHHMEQNLNALRLQYDPVLLAQIREITAPVYNYR